MDRPAGVLHRVGEILRTDNDAVRYSRWYIAGMIMIVAVGMMGCTLAHRYTVAHEQTLAISTQELATFKDLWAKLKAIADGPDPDSSENSIKYHALTVELEAVPHFYGQLRDDAVKAEQATPLLRVGRVLAALGF